MTETNEYAAAINDVCSKRYMLTYAQVITLAFGMNICPANGQAESLQKVYLTPVVNVF